MSYSLPPTTSVDPGFAYGGGVDLGGSSGGYGWKDFGSDFLGGLGRGLTDGLSSLGSSSGSPRGSYVDRTRSSMDSLLALALKAFATPESTI